MRCQLQAAYDGAECLSSSDKIMIRWRKRRRYLMETMKKVILDPMIVGRKLAAKLSVGNPRPSTCIASDGPAMKPLESIAPINLKEGERVRVKAIDEIKKILDHDGRTEGLGYMEGEMNKHCGGIYTIRKRINLFFDERRWRMLKIRNVLILDGVFCELPADAGNDWAGCDRTCFLFWKEAWLERLKPGEVGASATPEVKE